METVPYVDIHTHSKNSSENTIKIHSLDCESLLSTTFAQTKVTAGIHPWWLEDFAQNEIEVLKGKITKLAEEGKLFAIGETGIDRTMPELIEEQKTLFLWHLELSEKFELPLVIHNVRSGADLLELLKLKKPKMPWIFHDFRGSIELTKSILKLHENCFFSFGLSLDNSPQVRELVHELSLSHMFFETDAQKHLDIHDIYIRASGILGLDLDFLKSQIWLNFKKLEKNIH